MDSFERKDRWGNIYIIKELEQPIVKGKGRKKVTYVMEGYCKEIDCRVLFKQKWDKQMLNEYFQHCHIANNLSNEEYDKAFDAMLKSRWNNIDW